MATIHLPHKEPAEKALCGGFPLNQIVSGLSGKFMPQKFLSFCHFRIPSLTGIHGNPTLTSMCFARSLVAALSVALAAYGLDCRGMATLAHTMACCEKMRCHSLNHRNQNPQDCCKTTPPMQAALGQPSSRQTISVSAVAYGVMQAFNDLNTSAVLASISARHSHDPPLSGSVSTLPLRV